MHKLAILLLLLGLAAVPALSAPAATDGLSITVPSGIVSHAGDALVGAVVAALGWLASHRKLLRRISVVAAMLSKAPGAATVAAAPAVEVEVLAKAIVAAIKEASYPQPTEGAP
jgi:hypothetical protein